MVLPGELFGVYGWGTTNDPVAPGLSKRPVVVRATARYADPRAVGLLTSVDDLIQHKRLVPGRARNVVASQGGERHVVARASRLG